MCVCVLVFDLYFLVQTRRFDTCIYTSYFNDWSTAGHRKTQMTITFWLTNHPGDRCFGALLVTIRNLQENFSGRPQGRVQVQQANTKKNTRNVLKNTTTKNTRPPTKRKWFLNQLCHFAAITTIPVCLAMALMPIQTSALLKVRNHGSYQWRNRGFIPKILLWQHNITLAHLNQLGSIQFNHFFNIHIPVSKIYMYTQSSSNYISVFWNIYKHPLMPHATPYVFNTPFILKAPVMSHHRVDPVSHVPRPKRSIKTGRVTWQLSMEVETQVAKLNYISCPP